MVLQGKAPAELLRLESITKDFPGARALDSVSLKLHRGEVLALMGENGAGKSTLMNTLGCLDRPTTGSYLLDNEEIATMSRNARSFMSITRRQVTRRGSMSSALP